MLVVIRRQASLLSPPLPGHVIPGQEELRDGHIRVLPEHVGFGVVLEVPEVPPVGATSLHNNIMIMPKSRMKRHSCEISNVINKYSLRVSEIYLACEVEHPVVG